MAIPVTLTLIWTLTGMGQSSFSDQDGLTLEYLLTLVLFGAVLAYLRVVTDSVWTCVGFHLGFLQIGRDAWVGDDEQALIQIDATNAAPVDLLFQRAFLAAIIAILIYPWLIGRRPGWRLRGRN